LEGPNAPTPSRMTHDLTTNTTFAELGVADDLIAVLATYGVEEPFPMQAMTSLWGSSDTL
ncbi:hypothetical protein LCGC14_1652190, partial [marine sediment metagenome]